MSSPQRTNVALTRARHCLWILGNERTLTNSEHVWKDLVCDARNRQCLFDADSDEGLKMTVLYTKKELEQLDDLVNENSILFKHAKWKVLFSDDFRRSFGKLTTARLKKLVLNLLLRLSGGWRPQKLSVDLHCVKSSHILKHFKVAGLYVICTIDIIKEFNYVQVLKVWDILPFEEIQKLTRRLEKILAAYTDDYISRCTEKCMEGNLEVPKSWIASEEIIRFCFVRNTEVGSCENGAVKHLLSDKEQLDLPMQVSDEQMEIVLFSKSSFIIGRSGTGKTTILTMKLFQKEQSFYVASEGIYEGKRNSISDSKVDDFKDRKPSVLRQLFVTVNPNLCHVVKQHVSHLTSISCNGNTSLEVNLDYPDMISEFSDIADTFIDIPVKNYPLFITFHKFLMMLDGTLGNSFFERFPKAREASHGNHTTSRSVALQTFLRLREVTYDRFCTLYWPHFNSSLTKKLDPSRVFTEIISHIKGGPHAGDCSDGKLSYPGYCLLAESRLSTLTKEKRETIYYLFQAYEKMKSERGEFDLGDLVSDLHDRLKNGHYDGDVIDFVYIDEVQDLSMRQISLFKYICQNVDEGFIFAGDTAQTIARGIDFRFQDIRSLFYKEFLTKQEKGLVSEVFQLKQNFRTHAGVLQLAQSVIDILSCYFVHSIDILEPETSLISVEAPVLLESSNNENAIETIFGGSESGGKKVGFGADQVILVRDDCAKIEVLEYVGKNALVLTILECKGLEFQDVLLYNFFGTSPLKDQWRVIYGYMKECDWLDENLPQSFPTFSEARHSVLCSELKHLYVAITRTRQRLWVYENKEELSKPIFDYWKRRRLVQIRKLDDSVAQAMRVSSSPQEWRERGKKLFYENKFVMATMCFERAGDTMWEKLAKASGLRASADPMRGKNPEAYLDYLREAAELFESIGKFDSAASCYCDLEEFERAGKTYLYKCRKYDTAAECLTLAGCYSDAAEAYAKGDQVSNCLSVCRKGKLYDKGLQYIEYWKEHLNVRTKEIEETEQRFLESCALDCHQHKDLTNMVKFVRSFCSVESMRVFLRSLGCLEDLLLLEEESGHFLDALELARSLGYVQKEADLLEKAGHYREAADLLLWYVFFSSLWGNGGRGWPLKQFSKKEDLCEKARLLAKMTSDNSYDFVCNELKVLSEQQSSLPELKKVLLISQKNKSLRGEILSIRKILDSHLRINFSKYFWEDELPFDITKHCENQIFQNCVSVRTLVFYWNQWKENVMNIFQSIKCLENEELNNNEALSDFSISYFGVRKQCVNGNIVYLLVNKEGDWIRTAGNNGLHSEGKLLYMNMKQLAFAITSYWQLELLSVGMKVLLKLEGLYKSKSNGSAFHQSTSLVHIFEVSKFLSDCHCLHVTSPEKKKLQYFLGISVRYFDLVFPLDWRRSVSEDMVSLRETDLSLNLLDEIILQNVGNKSKISYWTIGRVMMVCFCSSKSVTLNEMIIKGLQWTPSWLSFAKYWNSGIMRDVAFFPMHRALKDSLWSDQRCVGHISPHSFMYLLDRLILMESFFNEILYTTKSSFAGWFTNFHYHEPVLEQNYLRFEVTSYLEPVAQQILYNKEDTESWIRRSNIEVSYYYPLLVLKLVMMVTLACLQDSSCSKLLFNLLTNNVAGSLPEKFVHHLLSKKKGHNLHLCPQMVAEAFMSIEDPLLIVTSGKPNSKINAPGAIFVDLETSKDEIRSALFPNLCNRFLEEGSSKTSEVDDEEKSFQNEKSMKEKGKSKKKKGKKNKGRNN
uniref:TPR and ankyrin repeat-containing protein 1-like n=1 Tax=Erigeron canadensis TaxID=72917 RepID=UPI001CB96078|nr:TPR and ankyrin repeat-containing protein 1-like [Erigeron canadensis]